MDRWALGAARATTMKLAHFSRGYAKRCLSTYLAATRASMRDQQFLSLGVDVGSGGKKKLWVGMVANPSSVAAAIPPLETIGQTDSCHYFQFFVFKWG